MFFENIFKIKKKIKIKLYITKIKKFRTNSFDHSDRAQSRGVMFHHNNFVFEKKIRQMPRINH